MSKFGWSMPAGAWESTLPGEEPEPPCCQHCERESCPEDDCPELQPYLQTQAIEESDADEAAYQEYVEMSTADLSA